MTDPEEMHLSVHPSVVFKLGADLITDDVQALVELIKNSYDAESPSAEITIDTNVWTDLRTGDIVEPPLSINPEDDLDAAAGEDDVLSDRQPVRGRITLSDRGTGMRLADIRDGWLTVSASSKKKKKEDLSLIGENERTPLGDKGLGRLGAQRLGQIITLTTFPRLAEGQSPAAVPGYRVSICWQDFENVSSLMSVPLQVSEIPRGANDAGTKLEIRGLYSPEEWSVESGGELERRLSTMMSPYKEVPGFKVRIRVNGHGIDLRERTDAIREKASVSYTLRYKDQVLVISGRVSLLYLRPPQGVDDIAVFDRLVGLDNGHSFLEWLVAKYSMRAADVGITSGDDQYFVQVNHHVDVSLEPDFERQPAEMVEQDEDEAELASRPLPPIIDPGPFTGEIEQVVLRFNPTNVFDSTDAYRDFVRAIRGVRVYRDGFGIRVPDDWLDLAAQWSSASSYYTIRPENVLGHIDLTARYNGALVETTNREAFSDTPAHRNFLRIVGQWLSYSERVQAFLRRGYNEYRKVKLAEVAEVSPTITPKALVARVQAQMDAMDASSEVVVEAAAAVDGIAQIATNLEAKKTELEGQLFTDPRVVAAYDDALNQVRSAAAEAKRLLASVAERSDSFHNERASLELLLEQVSALEEQVRDVWEAVSLGLTAEALSHEVNNVADRLRSRSAQITSYMRGADITDARIWSYVEHVRSTASALAKQLSRLDPSLRNVRESRDDLALSSVVAQASEYFAPRWNSKRIALEVEVIEDFTVRMNAGKLTQVFDNLLLNSEYWLERLIEDGGASTGEVKVQIEAPFVLVSDSGPGINPSIENSLFDPFVTTKPATQGRGLGLFVVKQLLDAEGIAISLDPERNERGRRSTFRLDFRRALNRVTD